jgi:ABC-type multidrug transport system ATPase subunit
MEVELNQISKRYANDWIFKDVDFKFQAGQNYAIKGANGSGKSTLMKILSSNLTPTKGKVLFKYQGQDLPKHKVYTQLAYAAPYVDLIEELTLIEALAFHEKFKAFRSGVSINTIVDTLNFKKAKSKYIQAYSSGMKQRVKLILAICSNVPFLLLDEPTSNLDQQGKNWYKELLSKYTSNTTVIIASNEEDDFVDCVDTLKIEEFKGK